MKFNPDRKNDPFRYKGYTAFIRRGSSDYIAVDYIEISLVKRAENRRDDMIIRFAISNRNVLYKCLHNAVKALKKAEVDPPPRYQENDVRE